MPKPEDNLSTLLSSLLASAIDDRVQSAVETALARVLPSAIRRATLPPYLTRSQLAELSGMSLRKIDYMRSKGQMPYIKHTRTVLFKTADVESYLSEGEVPSWAASVPNPSTAT